MSKGNSTGSRINVPMGEYRLARAPAILAVTGLGSCVALALHVPQSRWGAIAHIMLPDSTSSSSMPSACYADQAIEALLAELTAEGFKPEDCVAKVIGGASVLPLGETWPQVGKRNGIATLEGLQRKGIPLAAQDLGGKSHRSLEFDLETGLVHVRTPEGTRVL